MSRSKSLWTLAVLAWFALVSDASAGNWRLTPRFQIEETYTDNVRLTKNDRQGDFITSVSPGFSLRGESSRVSSNIDYNRQERFFFDQTNFDGGSNQLQADVKSTVVKNWLFFDVASRMSQQSIDSRRNISRIDRGNNNNVTDVTSYELMPRVQHTFGSLGTMDLSYSRQNLDRGGSAEQISNNPQASLGSSHEDGFELNLRSGPVTGRMPVGISAESRRVSHDGGRTDKFKRVSTDLSYVWSRSFRFIGRGGYEDNTFNSFRGSSNGPTWSVGGVWTPSVRTNVSVEWGDRAFGKALDINASYHLRRLHFDFAYGTDIRTINDFERGLVLVPLLDFNGLPIIDPLNGGQMFVPLDSPGAIDDVFVEKRITASIAYIMKRNTLNLSYFQYEREYQSDGRVDMTRGVQSDFQHQLRRGLRANLGLLWRMNDESTLLSNGSFYSVIPSLDYDLGPHTTLRFRYEFTVNNNGGGFGGIVDPAQSTYTENAISASLLFHL